MSRSVVSYDDLIPAQGSGAGLNSHSRSHLNPPYPPSKRQKRNQQYGGPRSAQHWDDPSASSQFGPSPSSDFPPPSTAASATPVVVSSKDDEDNGNAVDLTQEDIWDDSALINAWDAAQEEYRLLNGPEKDWKTEPVHKSALWYHDPSTSKKRPLPPRSEMEEDLSALVPEESITAPPTAPKSVPVPTVPIAGLPNGEATPLVSQDEAFQNALNAMYWTGYWTAAYHYQGIAGPEEVERDDDGEDVIEVDGAEEGEFLNTQR